MNWLILKSLLQTVTDTFFSLHPVYKSDHTMTDKITINQSIFRNDKRFLNDLGKRGTTFSFINNDNIGISFKN